MIRIQSEDFDMGEEVEKLSAGCTDIGAVVAFVGIVRGAADGVSAMEIEHYPGMARVALEDIETDARARWALQQVLIIHRYGTLSPGQRIVLVATAAAHRQDAFAAAEFLMDFLKTRAPFWKRETTPTGTQWVEAAVKDDEAAERWATPKATV